MVHNVVREADYREILKIFKRISKPFVNFSLSNLVKVNGWIVSTPCAEGEGLVEVEWLCPKNENEYKGVSYCV